MSSSTPEPRVTELSAEKLASMKRQSSGMESEIFSEPSTPNGGLRKSGLDYSSGATNGSSSSRSAAHSSHALVRSSRRSSASVSSHRMKMSTELTAAAEAKFFALMDMMASASREAASLKESWYQIISEREAFTIEREEMVEQINEFAKDVERRDGEKYIHGNEIIERKKHIERLMLELSTAVAGVTAEKKKIVEREAELDRTRTELREIRESATHTQVDHDRLRAENETLSLSLRTAQGDRDSIKVEAERLQRELHKTTRERTEVNARLADVTTDYDLSRKEILSLNDRLKFYDVEREDSFQEISRLKEEARKARIGTEEVSKNLLEITGKFERQSHEILKLRDAIKMIEAERDESSHRMELKIREVQSITVHRDEANDKVAEMTTKFEQLRRELVVLKGKLRDAETERLSTLEIIEKTREQHRLILIERDELGDEVSTARRRADDSQRQVVLLTDTLRKAEQTATDIRSEVYSLTEKYKNLERERDDWRGKNAGLVTEITDLRAQIVIFDSEMRTVVEARDRVRDELNRRNQDFEEITETMTTYKDDSGELEFEIQSLRTLLRESREQKERAIAARNSADRERDEYVVKYEDKCREMERFEESAASNYHASASVRTGGSTTTTSRVFSSHSDATNID